LLTLFPENCTEDENSQAVLYALSVLPPQSTQQCCYDILSFLREKNIKDLKIKNKLTVVVYLICLESLKAISIDELFDTVFDESVNEYTTYLQIDAVICRSILNELLGEYSLAQDDLSQLGKFLSFTSCISHLLFNLSWYSSTCS
jgi:hypothetical protein